MNPKSIAKGLVTLNILALIVTAALAWGLDRSTSTELLDLVTYVGLGMGALGSFMFVGSTSGSSGSTGMAASAADQPSRIMEALWIDRSAGISTGALFVLGGVIWLGLGWLALTLLSASCGKVDPVFRAKRCASLGHEHRIDPKSGIHF